MSILSSLNPLIIGFILLCVISIILVVLVLWMYFRQRRFLVGFDSKQIGDSLAFVSKNLNDLQDFRKELESYLTTVENRLQKSVQAIHTVRFNPFKGAGEGGNQSFATAFLNQEGSGVVVSSIYSRDHVSIFSKPVKNFASEYELSNEERTAIDTAKSNLKA